MSKADVLFVNMCRDILENGYSTEGQKVRPHWEDGTPAYTIKKFGVVNRYDLSEEFPALTLRPTAIKSAVDELLWIWQKKSNDVHELRSHIWDSWADEDGEIGKAYGYQMGIKYKFHQGYMDQVDNVIWQLKNTPYSRRILTNIYNFADLSEMNLEPCAYSMTFNVTREKVQPSPGSPAALDRMPDADENGERLVLNAVLNQRSNDVLTANNWNVAQYAILLMMIAQASDMVPGELVHMIADAHIYDRHIPLIRELITRAPLPAPKVWLDPDITDFYSFTTDNLHYENYETHEQIRNIPVAI